MRNSMKKKMLSIFSALLIAILMTSTAGARGVIILSANFSLGSLIASGTASARGQGNAALTLVLDASGIPAITCTNNGENDVPGQSFPTVSASGRQDLNGDDLLKKGKSPFSVETVDPTTIAWDAAGCPSSNWTARIDFIYWTNATISVYDTTTTPWTLLKRQDYLCTTTHDPDSVTCTLIN